MTTDLPDVNVLIAIHFEDHEHHHNALAWFTQGHPFATTAITETGFLRVSMNPTVMAEPFSPSEALEALRRLRHLDRTSCWADDTSLAESALAGRLLTGHNQVTDLQLLGLAISRSGRLVTFDRKIAASLRPSERRVVLVLDSD